MTANQDRIRASAAHLAEAAAPSAVLSATPSVTLIVSLVLATALGPLAMSSFIPAIPFIQDHFAVSTTTAQLTLTLSMLAMAFTSLAYGGLADRYGRKPVLIAGITLAVAGSLVCAAAPNVWVVIVGRILQSGGASAGMVLTRVIVRDVYGDERSVSILAYVTAAMAIAPLVGPILGGYLIDYFGWRAIFLAVAALATLLTGLLALRLPETRPAHLAAARPGKAFAAGQYKVLLARFPYVRYTIYGAMMQGIFMAFIGGAPYVATEVFQLSAAAYGWHFMVAPIGYLTGSLIAGRFGSRLSREPLLTTGALLAVIVCAVALWTTFQPWFGAWTFFMPMFVLSCVIGLVFPSAQVGLLISGGEQAGAASGLFSFVQLAVGALLAQTVGALLDFGPIAVSAVMTGAAVVALAAIAMRPPCGESPG
ncbi:MAG: multidrug effflux MFS transporter [Gammaproteobacteria bacterium]|nr:multidrug effflux MFS transporter [Gammaproteobacteria bacterium]